MQSRRKSLKVEPISVLRTSLISNPVTSIAAPDAGSFSNVLVEAVEASRAVDSSSTHHNGVAVRMDAALENSEALRPIPSLLQYNQSIDLYVQLDTLLREKSLLIAIV
jgi:hypothetical protein